MSNLKIMNFEDGLSFIVQTVISKNQDKPVLVFVDGFPNSGKTELRKRAIEELYNRGKVGCGFMRGDSLNKLPEYVNGLDYLLIEDVGADSTQVDLYTEQNFGKKTDLRVYITKRFSLDALPDRFKEQLEKENYIIVENPAATSK